MRRSDPTGFSRSLFCGLCAALVVVCIAGCGGSAPIPGGTNTTDPTNGGAAYLGAATCNACHPGFGERHALHAHSQVLKLTEGAQPTYPVGPGVPQPPPGFTWPDIDLVIGGYLKAASFVDRDGYLLTPPGNPWPPLLYHLPFPLTGEQGGFIAGAGDIGRAPYSFDCFRCHTTGPLSVASNGGRRQGNQPGIGGTWEEAGVQCEACHGPGGNHVPNPSASNIYLDTNSTSCARCHNGYSDGGAFTAAGGYIVGNQQFGEVAASPHQGFSCSVCHDPHTSVFHAPARDGIRNQCSACHSNMNMALHEGRIFVQGDYVEPLSCQSCHMPFASKYATAADPSHFGTTPGRAGDTRTHLMLIDTRLVDFTAMFTPDLATLRLDASGRAAATLDFVCLRCHHGQGSAFELSLSAVSGVAESLHRLP